MEQQDHIATLCAAGTVGVAAAGLALGVQAEDETAYSTTPGKRKWPGASSIKSSTIPRTPLPSRRVASQPSMPAAVSAQDSSDQSKPSSLFKRHSKREVRPMTASATDSDATGSRASSMNRSGLFRPRTADTRSTSEQRDPSTSSSWLKRISTISSPRSVSPNAPFHRPGSAYEQDKNMTSVSKDQILPNKLVKRSTSQRALSQDQARGTFLRRPATSHQRSVTVQEWAPQTTSISTPATPYLTQITEPVWRPFFERGYPRKRLTSAHGTDDQNLKTISMLDSRHPTLLLGSQLEPSGAADERAEQSTRPTTTLQTMSTGRQRLRRSLSSMHRASRRRHFTDPTVQVTTEAVNGTISPAVKRSPSSSASPYLAFDIDMPQGSPTFHSSPPLMTVHHKFSLMKRRSMVPSDPTTTSSDNDTRVFTDDDSMDFQSDTAHDSLNTRATVSSHSAFRAQKADAILAGIQNASPEQTDHMLAQLIQDTTLTNREHETDVVSARDGDLGVRSTVDSATSRTPVKSRSPDIEDINKTPVAPRTNSSGVAFESSPPSPMPAFLGFDTGSPRLVLRSRHTDCDPEDIDWSPKSDANLMTTEEKSAVRSLRDHLSSPVLPSQESGLGLIDYEDGGAEKRLSSIFDWSEHQKFSTDGGTRMLLRPKTVHGKQGNDGSRSRSSGRKGPTQLHLRSQSVPNNRDPNTEPPALSNTKFGTWGLGHKPVSEEWSDDFEFDDTDENDSPQISSDALRPDTRGTIRGVKVPQAIIDRQASVHIQFGQVQEFMLLVEELKQLRARGTTLQLLESHSKQLWEDAESIIDLATINDEDDEDFITPDSPTPSDAFTDDITASSKPSQEKVSREDSKKHPVTNRSVSSPATPPRGRPRGESLAQAKSFLQTIHQSRTGYDSSPLEYDHNPQKKLPFDTQDLKDLVIRSGVITRALKEIVRKAEGLSVSPTKSPPGSREPAFSRIFHAPDVSPCPPFRKPGLPKSKSANSYLIGTYNHENGSVSAPQVPTALVL